MASNLPIVSAGCVGHAGGRAVDLPAEVALRAHPGGRGSARLHCDDFFRLPAKGLGPTDTSFQWLTLIRFIPAERV